MILSSNNPWETEDRHDMVHIGSHKLHVSSSGRPRKPGDAAVLFFSGGGAPAVMYIRLQRLLGEHARVYFHDRSGYDQSERGPHATLTAQQAAEDLKNLLAVIRVGPPYVLIGHSYGGICARAFLEAVSGGSVTGMVLADTASELMLALHEPKIPHPSLQAVGAGVDFAELTNLRNESALTDDEWEKLLEAVQRTQAAAKAEDNRGSAWALAQAQQFRNHALGPCPLVVICCNPALDYRRLYDAGLQRGQGTEVERGEALHFIERFGLFLDIVAAAQLRLTNVEKSRKYVQWLNVGHDDIIRRPGLYVEQVLWVLEQRQVSGRA
ncbi:Alpha/beta-hydrolase [Teratosphaeria destructans]|uniref:Alpha/beta-hydrolase n=1 Tax=Teratosphaeria destructans TaxID=418781 RepID=A0A9W7W028_9PEZI|nr:Alpha/beta-hydrolase [Teratosphaeria destructans]